MAWVEPKYTRPEVNRAGRVLISVTASENEREEALQIINNWRASHSFPLNTFRQTLRNKARKVDAECLVAQRIKRLSSIAYKLRRFPTMNLAQMQDIGGCRVVVSNVSRVRALRRLYDDSDLKHHLARIDDYIAQPKPSGYRSIHLIYRYRSDRKETYNGLQIEMQLRSQLQHAWATAVETVGTFLEQPLKASRGPGDWLRFLTLMGSAIALRERTPIVPATPTSKAGLVQEIREYATRLDVEKMLRGYGTTLQALEMPKFKTARYFLLDLRPSEGKLTVTGFNGADLDQATTAYLDVEKSLQGPGSEAVLVSVESVESLRRAYPNYFLDTEVFLDAMRRAIS